MLLQNRLFLPLLVALLLGSCTIKRPFSYQQVLLTDQQLQQALQTAPKTFADSTITLALGEHYQRNAFHRWMWGDRNRELWLTPVTFQVLDMNTKLGGLTPKKRGGGMQSKSLRLEDKTGNDFVLRSIDKEPASALPKALRKSFLVGIVRDQTSSMHPFGPLVVPQLAKAAGLMHTRPQYVYVPHDPALGEYVKEFGGMVALLEGRAGKEDPEYQLFGKIEDVVNSQEALHLRFSDPEVRNDQRMFARARLFDMLIGDWDRHEGQWNWAVYKSKSGTLLRPIPQDRDQVFYRLGDGWLSWLLTRFGPLKKLQTFDDRKIDVKSYAYNARFIDKRVLTELTRQDWAEIADSLQRSLTDTVLATAIKALPEPIYKKTAGEMFLTLRARRKQLPEVARQFYLLMSKEVEIVGTDKKEKFVIQRLNDNETLVEVFELNGDKNGPKIYSRTFFRNETKRLYLYGLRGEDDFEVTGQVDKGITVHIVGGIGEDKVKDTSKVSGWFRKTRVHDTRYGVEIEGGKETKDKTRRTVRVHAFDEEGL